MLPLLPKNLLRFVYLAGALLSLPACDCPQSMTEGHNDKVGRSLAARSPQRRPLQDPVNPEAPNLIKNGGFETPRSPLEPIPFLPVLAGGDIGSWKVGGASVDVVPSITVSPAEGSQSIDLTGSPGAGSVSQTIDTTPGQVYELRFAMAGNPGFLPDYPSPMVKQMNVVWNGKTIDTPTFDTTERTVTNPGWTYLRYAVTATNTTSTIQFVSLTPGALGPMIDDVSLRAVTPLPQR